MHMNPVYRNELKMSARSMQIPVLAVIFNSILSRQKISCIFSNGKKLQAAMQPLQGQISERHDPSNSRRSGFNS